MCVWRALANATCTLKGTPIPERPGGGRALRFGSCVCGGPGHHWYIYLLRDSDPSSTGWGSGSWLSSNSVVCADGQPLLPVPFKELRSRKGREGSAPRRIVCTPCCALMRRARIASHDLPNRRITASPRPIKGLDATVRYVPWTKDNEAIPMRRLFCWIVGHRWRPLRRGGDMCIRCGSHST